MEKIVLFLVFSFVCLFSSCGINDDEPEMRSLVDEGDRIPSFEVIVDGRTVTDESLRGKSSLIVFFSTGCPDCRRALPMIERVYRQRPDLEILCISRSEGEEEVSAYWKENSLTLQYSAQTDDTVYRLFATSGIPRLYAVGPDLMVTAVYSEEDFR